MKRNLIFSFIVLMAVVGLAKADTVILREGLDGYAATQDTWFSNRTTGGENNGFPEGSYFRTATWGTTNQQALLRFDEMFDDEGGPIPIGSVITSATLTIHVPTDIKYSDGEANAIHKMLVDWVETDAYAADPWVGGATQQIDRDDVEAASVATDDCTEYAINNKIPQGTTMTFDVSPIVEDWANGDSNYGFLFQSLGLNAGDGFFMASSEYAGVATETARPTLEVEYIFNPKVLITESEGTTVVYEQGLTTDDFEVVLALEPDNDVEITVEPNTNTQDYRLVGAAGPGFPIKLTFTTGNWNTAQTVTVKAVDDPDPEGPEIGKILFHTVSDDPNFDDIAVRSVRVNVVDNDRASVVIDPITGLEVDEEGETTDQYTVVLQSQPGAEVTISTSDSSDPNEVMISPSTLTFTTANWATPQTVTVKAIDDDVLEAVGGVSHTTLVSNDIASDDLEYDSLILSSVLVKIFDNECGAWDYDPMDFDENCYVDLKDFAEFASHWLNCSQPA
ncbi:MAG: DNRLRE domain-containing protein, partial [Sedimentisphaerales bacterium]|nr:DNRLRE domain-containing protein [Sedimentisphaerales bacterium]